MNGKVILNPNKERVLKLIADGAELHPAVILKLGDDMVVVESSQVADLRAEGHLPRHPTEDANTCLKPVEQTLPKADHILADVCSHGTVHLVLADAVGEPFAVAQMPWNSFAEMANGLTMDFFRQKGIVGVAVVQEPPTPDPGETKH